MLLGCFFGVAGIETFLRENVNWQYFQEHYDFSLGVFNVYFSALTAGDYLECECGLSHCVHMCMGLEGAWKGASLGLSLWVRKASATLSLVYRSTH